MFVFNQKYLKMAFTQSKFKRFKRLDVLKLNIFVYHCCVNTNYFFEGLIFMTPKLAFLQFAVYARLFTKLPQPEDSEMSLRPSNRTATCYYQSNHSKAKTFR